MSAAGDGYITDNAVAGLAAAGIAGAIANYFDPPRGYGHLREPTIGSKRKRALSQPSPRKWMRSTGTGDIRNYWSGYSEGPLQAFGPINRPRARIPKYYRSGFTRLGFRSFGYRRRRSRRMRTRFGKRKRRFRSRRY